LVQKVGISIIAMASFNPSAAVNSAKDTDGKPRPMTPLTVPANINVTVMIMIVSGDHITMTYLLNSRCAIVPRALVAVQGGMYIIAMTEIAGLGEKL
jgi:hypothetical protein